MIGRLLALADGVSVQIKIMGIVAGMSLLFGLGATYELRQRIAGGLGRELEERAVSIARDLAARSSDLILTNNTFGLYELARDTLENNQDVRYVLVLGRTGAPLVHTFGERLPAGLVEDNSVGPLDRHHLEILETEEGLIRDVAVPIFDGFAGTARVGLSDRRLERELARATRELLLLTGAVGLAGLGVAYLLTLILTRPISDLVQVVRSLGQGDLRVRVRPRTHDEIGVLGQAFNTMAENLAQSHAEREEYNHRLLRSNRELAALNLMATAVSQSKSLQEVLDIAIDRSLQLTSLTAGWIWLVVDDEASLRLGAQRGLTPLAQLLGLEGPRRGCECFAVIATGQARFVNAAKGRCGLLSPDGFCGHLSVPLVTKGRVLGVMNLATTEHREFTQEELDILGAIGSQIGVAIENAGLWEELLRKQEVQRQLLDSIIRAQEEERKRIARELHDETSQVLTSLVLGMERLRDESGLPEAARERAAHLQQLTSRALEDVHHLSMELRPSALDDAGLVPGIARYLREYGPRHGLEVDYRTVGVDGLRLLPTAETAVFRIVQEALTNVVRHARAQGVSVLLERRGANLVAVVEDDGCGFDNAGIAEASLKDRLGLAGMAERAALVGGRLTLESQLGQGTTVFVAVPLADNLQVGDADGQTESAVGR